MDEIDIDRGVQMRQIVAFDAANPKKFDPDPAYGGMMIYMYVDTPGEYMDVHGKAVPAQLAKLAGFDVEKLAKARAKREALKAFEDELAKALEAESDDDEEILAEDGGYKVIALPLDRAKVVDADTGEAVVAVPMPRKDALKLLAALTATAADVAAKTAEVPVNPKKEK